MYLNRLFTHITTPTAVVLTVLIAGSCGGPGVVQRLENKTVPNSFSKTQSKDTTNTAKISWKKFFEDPNLNTLIDTALKNNQELNIIAQEINISKNEIRARKGEYLPFVNFGAGAGIDKVGRYTRKGALEATTDIRPGEEFPDPLPDFVTGLQASWELDIWKKLRNAKKAATLRYLSSIEGRNFLVTNLVAEIAETYYELLALDTQLEILKTNIDIQSKALEVVKLEKEAAEVTELAVKKFQAEVLKNKSKQYTIQQKIVETENKINFLVGRYPQPVKRNAKSFNSSILPKIYRGIPSQMLQNRPDIRSAELGLSAAKLDIKVAKARFYPSLRMNAGIGYRAFNAKYLISPESLIYSIAGDLMAPLINRNAIKAAYYNAGSKQVQAAYNYEKTLLNAFVEVTNQLAKIDNLKKSLGLKNRQVEALTLSIEISTKLFQSARADYMEVLMTQRDALEAKMELTETKMQQMKTMVKMYRALGGGWR